MPILSLPHFPFHHLRDRLLPALHPRWDTNILAPNSQEDRSMDYPSRSSSADPLSQPGQSSTASHLSQKLVDTISENDMDTDEPSSSDPAGLGAYADGAPQNDSKAEEGQEAYLSTLQSISSPRHRPASRINIQDDTARPASRVDVHRDTGVSTPKLPNDDQNHNVFFNDDHHPFPMIDLAPSSENSKMEKSTQSSSSTPTQHSPSLNNDSSSRLEQGTQSQYGSQSQQGTQSQYGSQSQQHTQSQQSTRSQQRQPTEHSKPTEPSADDPAADEGEPSDALTPLEAYDWDGLEAEFEAEMKKCQDREDGYVEEFGAWVMVSHYPPPQCDDSSVLGFGLLGRDHGSPASKR